MAAGDGLVTMTPTSIAVAGAGSSASIQSDGSVDFSAATSLSLNGVFTSAFDNYLLVIRHTMALGNDLIQIRLRVSGTDASGTDYTRQRLLASSTTVQGLRSTSQTSAAIGYSSADNRSGDSAHIYGPALAQATAFRNVNAGDISGASIYEYASTHSLATAYDGCTLIPASSSISGSIVVFGYEE